MRTSERYDGGRRMDSTARLTSGESGAPLRHARLAGASEHERHERRSVRDDRSVAHAIPRTTKNTSRGADGESSVA